MSRNLTGSKRIIYDSCVDLHNAVQKWQTITAASHSVIMQIWKVKQEEINKLGFMKEKYFHSHSSEDIYDEMQKLSFGLLNKIENLELIVKKIQGIVTKMKAIFELSDLHQSNNSDISTVVDYIPFKTWSLTKFSAVAEEIAFMFQEEFISKSSICKEICHVIEKPVFLFFEACWKYEPNINKCRLSMLLDGIICELDLFSEIN